jgi:1-acyl-sn-glycerol-3-phosphate acyltransferase
MWGTRLLYHGRPTFDAASPGIYTAPVPAKQKSKHPPRSRGSAPSAPVRPVLGNDPFQRGAAVQIPAPSSEPQAVQASEEQASPPPLSDATPASSSSEDPAGARNGRADQVAQASAQLEVPKTRGERARDGDPAGLSAAAGDGHPDPRSSAELRTALDRLLPALMKRLPSVSLLWSWFENPLARDRYGMDRAFLERLGPLLEFLYRSYWRVETRTIDRVPADGPAVLVANHGGNLPWDALVLQLALSHDHPTRRGLRPLLDEESCRAPLLGWASARFGAVPATPENAAGLLSAGELVGVFPEGSAAGRKPWSERYRLRRFGRGGFVKLALRAGAPIVPCAILGSEEVTLPVSRPGWLAERLGLPFLSFTKSLPLGPLGLLPLPSRWSIRFGAPIDTRSLGPAAADDPVQVAELTEQVRTEVQQMLDRDIARRTAVFL